MEAIVGVVGTLLGTLLGWLLNNWSKKGKLNIFLIDWNDQFKTLKFGVSSNSLSKEDTKSYHYYCSLDLYNSSSETKIMRDFKIVYKIDNKEIWADYPLDNSTCVKNTVGYHYDELRTINIPPKSVVKISLQNGLHSEEILSSLWNTVSIFLQYKDENNKDKFKLLKVENFNDYDFTKE